MVSTKGQLSPKEGEQKIVLKDDFELLNMMLADSKNQTALYNPGPYWIEKANNTANEILRCGIGDFRGSKSLVGMSYTDNLFIDHRNMYNHGIKKFAKWIMSIFPLNKIYSAQIRWTEVYAARSIMYAQEILNLKERTKYLLKKYRMPYSLLGNCLNKVEIDKNEISIHYLDILEQHDNIASRINFQNAKSVFEIGGGFGANMHLLLENYKNIKKVLYLDIPPNLYVGTQ